MYSSFELRQPFPNDASTPLEQIKFIDDRDVGDKDLYYFTPPHLEEKYVVRALVRPEFVDPDLFENGETKKQFAVRSLQRELPRAESSGIKIPRTVIGLPYNWDDNNFDEQFGEQAMLVTERIRPIDCRTVDRGMLRTQVEGVLGGMAAYLNGSWTPERIAAQVPFLSDINARQFVYGMASKDEIPDFYMVDTELVVDLPGASYLVSGGQKLAAYRERIIEDDVTEFEEWLGLRGLQSVAVRALAESLQ